MHMSPGLHDSSSFIFLSLLIERIKINFFMQPQNECIFDTKYSPLLFNLSQVLIGMYNWWQLVCCCSTDSTEHVCTVPVSGAVNIARKFVSFYLNSHRLLPG